MATAAQQADESELQHQLASALGWDPTLVEGVVGAIVSASSEQEVEDVVVNFMGNNPVARDLVMSFRARRAQSFAASRKGGSPAKAAASVNKQPTAAGSSGSGGLGALQDFQHRGPAGTRAGGAIQARVAKPRAGKGKQQQQQGAGGSGAGGQEAPKQQEVVRRIVNCLSCGKIFDCREDTVEIKMFLESKGRCTFCGEPVPSLYGLPPSAPAVDKGKAQEGSVDAEAAHLAAMDLRDRLVDFDRNSAARTMVVDDQSDYFAIDSNVWLDDSERRALAERQAALEEAEAQKGSRITVAIDLMGRKVVMSAEDDRTSGAEPSSGGFAFESETDRLRAKTAQAAEATAREIPQGGGMAIRGGDLPDGGVGAGPVRISANPELNGAPSPLFLPRDTAADVPPAHQQRQAGTDNASGGGRGGKEDRGKGRKQGKKQRRGAAAASRLQHDDPLAEIAQDEHQQVDASG